MREQTKYRGIRTQIFLLAVIGFVFSLQHIGTYYQLGEAGPDFYQPMIIHVGINVITPFLIWVASTILITYLARFVTGRLLIGDIFRLSGWALLPVLVSGLIQSAGRLYALQDAEAPELGLYSQLSTEWNVYRTYLEGANTDPAFIVATIIAGVFVLYSGYLLTTAIEEIGDADDIDVSTQSAAVLSAVLVLLCLGWLSAPFTL